jgi:putative restriction endonuclease
MNTLDNQGISERFRSLAVWSKGGQRAPHKPLLCLLAISKLFREKERLLPFGDIEKPLQDLLTGFGPPRKVCHPEYPFWALQHDKDIWEVRTSSPLPDQSSEFPTRAALIRSDAEAGFRPAVYLALKNDEGLRSQIVSELLDSHFPGSMHEDILQSLGLTTIAETLKIEDRNPEFREKVLSSYEYRCAVCGFNVRIGHFVVALEAAHIKWHQAGGPDVNQNGLSLCCLHHKLFDRGAFTIDEDHCAIVSEKAYGTEGFAQALGRFHRKPLLQPNRECYKPKLEFLKWHMNQVFLPPSRE